MAMELKQDCGVVLFWESLIWHIAHCASRNFLSAIVVSTRSNSIVSKQSRKAADEFHFEDVKLECVYEFAY